MILSIAPVQTLGVAPLALALMAVLAYAVAAWPTRSPSRLLPAPALVAGWLLHAVLLGLDIGGWGRGEPGARLGFGPVLSVTVWLVLAVLHRSKAAWCRCPACAVAGLATVRRWCWWPGFPGEVRPIASALGAGALAAGRGLVRPVRCGGAAWPDAGFGRARAAPAQGRRQPAPSAWRRPACRPARWACRCCGWSG
jgi:hypothetical protein